jgi:hypothetical protein
MSAFITGTYGHEILFDVALVAGEFVATLDGAPSIRGLGANPREAVHSAVRQVNDALAAPKEDAEPWSPRGLAESIRDHAQSNGIRDEELVAYIAERLKQWQAAIIAHGDGLAEQLVALNRGNRKLIDLLAEREAELAALRALEKLCTDFPHHPFGWEEAKAAVEAARK